MQRSGNELMGCWIIYVREMSREVSDENRRRQREIAFVWVINHKLAWIEYASRSRATRRQKRRSPALAILPQLIIARNAPRRLMWQRKLRLPFRHDFYRISPRLSCVTLCGRGKRSSERIDNGARLKGMGDVCLKPNQRLQRSEANHRTNEVNGKVDFV